MAEPDDTREDQPVEALWKRTPQAKGCGDVPSTTRLHAVREREPDYDELLDRDDQ